MELFFTELRTTDVDDYLLMGFDGHGLASRAMHYYLVQGPLALFLQLSWGHAFEDSDAQDVKFFYLADSIPSYLL